MVNNTRLSQRCLASSTGETRNWNSPDTLAGDTPVGTIGNHAMNAIAAPRRNPFHLFIDDVQSFLAESIFLHRNEPLLGCAEDYRVFAAPAVGIRMRDGSVSE